jgi:hypothetical protein
MSSKSSKRRGRPIVVDGVKYYWKISIEDDQSVLHVLMPTGRRFRALLQWSNSGREVTPKDVATFIRDETTGSHRRVKFPYFKSIESDPVSACRPAVCSKKDL